jgi:hypothetical protein
LDTAKEKRHIKQHERKVKTKPGELLETYPPHQTSTLLQGGHGREQILDVKKCSVPPEELLTGLFNKHFFVLKTDLAS